MNHDDKFFSDLIFTIIVIVSIVLFVILKTKGFISMQLGLYIGICVVILLANSYSYLPVYSIYFIILKIIGRLILGWGWIVVAIVLDIVFETYVSEFRDFDYTKYSSYDNK